MFAAIDKLFSETVEITVIFFSTTNFTENIYCLASFEIKETLKKTSVDFGPKSHPRRSFNDEKVSE